MSDKRMRILLASKEMFERQGYHETKMAQIAKQADVGKGTLYEYFDSKQVLFEEMMKFLLSSGYEYLIELLDKEKDPVEKLRVVANLEKEIARDHGQLFTVVLERMHSASLELKEVFKQSRIRQLKLVEEILDEGIQAGVFKEMSTKHFSYIFKGAISQAMMSESCGMGSGDEASFSDELFDILIASIKS